MSDPPPRSGVALIAGPTASGKSALALALAEALEGHGGGTIVNADASQLYRDLRVLTARPSRLEEARAPHRLFGTRDGADPASAAAWAAEARAEIAAAHEAGRLPILVGGTGLYLRTLLNGIAPVPPIPDEIRAAVRALPVAEAYAALAALDPQGAARVRPADTTRVARALEVVRATGRPLSAWQREAVGGIDDRMAVGEVVLLPPRPVLHARAAARFTAMLADGAVEEVRTLVARRLDPALPVMRAIGVAEIAAWLTGAIDRATMIERAVNATRQYAKRQTTWFRHQSPADLMRVEDATSTHENAIMLRDCLLTRSFMSPRG